MYYRKMQKNLTFFKFLKNFAKIRNSITLLACFSAESSLVFYMFMLCCVNNINICSNINFFLLWPKLSKVRQNCEISCRTSATVVLVLRCFLVSYFFRSQGEEEQGMGFPS